MKLKLKGLKKAVGDYNRFNDGGPYSPYYGILMYNYDTGELWTDEFYDYGHNSYCNYTDDSIINLSSVMRRRGVSVSMKNIKEFLSYYTIDEILERVW